MFIFNDPIHANRAVLARFGQLDQEDKKPKMAVCRGRLFLIAFEPHGLIETIIQLFKSIIAKFLTWVGLLSQDPNKIEALRKQVIDYQFDRSYLVNT